MIIRDPIHGDLAFTESERRVMDTPQMQRLRGVRQTGSANLVYPGCVHTRCRCQLLPLTGHCPAGAVLSDLGRSKLRRVSVGYVG